MDAYAAPGYVANWRMIFRGTGYAAATATPSPMQHTWSLAIEEQFYLVSPLIVAGLPAWLSARRRAERPDGSLYPEDRPERVDAWNRLLHAAAGRHPGRVTLLDLNAVVCPDGRFIWLVGDVKIRSDGLHYTPAGVQRVIAPRLAAVAAGTHVTPAPPTFHRNVRGDTG